MIGRWRRLLLPALRGLLAHRARSLLAALGVAVGVAAVLLVAGLGEAARTELSAGLSGQGAGLLVVRPADARRLPGRPAIRGREPTLSPEDAAALEALPQVLAVAPARDGGLRLRAGGAGARALVLGTSASFARVRGFPVAPGGAFFSEEDDARGERVAVLGARLAAALFPGQDPVGKPVLVGGVPFQVVGALEPQGVTADGADVDGQAYVPLRTALRRLFNARSLTAAFVRLRPGAAADRVAAEASALLRERHRLEERGRGDDFSVQDPARAAAVRRRVAGAVTALTGGLAAISLGVGGAGILALMLLSVRERTAEIGLRRALGARPRDVLAQFLAEAVALAGAGGLAGLLLGALGARGAAFATGLPIRTTGWAAAAGLGAALAVGILAGAWPARRAARLPPAVALSRE